jgi:hypothetical protein
LQKTKQRIKFNATKPNPVLQFQNIAPCDALPPELKIDPNSTPFANDHDSPHGWSTSKTEILSKLLHKHQMKIMFQCSHKAIIPSKNSQIATPTLRYGYCPLVN